MPEDYEVDILEELPLTDLRVGDVECQTTESSSSFGDSDSDGLSSCAEVADSLSQDRNGASVLEHSDPSTSKSNYDRMVGGFRSRKPLNSEWKECRCDIEWRCRWMELRVKQLHTEGARYDRFLHQCNLAKSQRFWQETLLPSSARIRALAKSERKVRVLRRKRRQHLEDNTNSYFLNLHRHPLCSRYEKKRRSDQEGVSIEVVNGNENEEFSVKENRGGYWMECSPDSVELQLLCDIELLEAKIQKLKHELNEILNELKSSSSKHILKSLSLSVSLGSLYGSSFPQSPKFSTTNLLEDGLESNTDHHHHHQPQPQPQTKPRDFDYNVNGVGRVLALACVESAPDVLIKTLQSREVGNQPPAKSDGGQSSDEEEIVDKKENGQYADLKMTMAQQGCATFGCEEEDNVKRLGKTLVNDHTAPGLQTDDNFQNVQKRKRKRRLRLEPKHICKRFQPLISSFAEMWKSNYNQTNVELQVLSNID